MHYPRDEGSKVPSKGGMGGNFDNIRKNTKKPKPKPIFFFKESRRPPSPLVLQIFPLQPPAQASNFAAGSTIIFFSQTDTISLPSPLLPLSLKPNQSSHSAPTPFSFQNRSRNRSLLSHDCYPISFSSTTFIWGAPDFLFLLTQKNHLQKPPLSPAKGHYPRPKRKANLSSSQRRTDPHFGSGHLPIGRSQPNGPAPSAHRSSPFLSSSPSSSSIFFTFVFFNSNGRRPAKTSHLFHPSSTTQQQLLSHRPDLPPETEEKKAIS
ncbi:hypothetical protein BDE02_07G037800 [Populus trichocarpa]|nr:hypothetical protein BDE02_07G037800 [Populus trichocarpa]